MEPDFEKKIYKIDEQIHELKKYQSLKGIDYSSEILSLEEEKVTELKNIYSNLTAWQVVQIARHPKRPVFQDYLENIITDFKELYGDRCFGDDESIVTGLGRIGEYKVMIIGQNKRGKTKRADKKIEEINLLLKTNKKSKENPDLERKREELINEQLRCKAGCTNPEGYRKALLKMKFAEKYNIPVVTFIDTPGAYPGICAEERGQASAIARNLTEMSRLKVPIISIVIGEGGSGGALGIGVADRVAMLEHSYYSVISPEGCAAILLRDGKKAEEAAEALKLTSKDLLELKLIDNIIREPLGGAHRNHRDAFYNVKEYAVKNLNELKRIKIEELLKTRYEKLRNIGKIKSVSNT
ncbi:MAG: carboxyl transferase domain-containing protein [Candidatus Nanoarchaeia archaeon]|nr:carboxyl transferase domain-containing protein [Candidatus Nanoarchaeia archaeon]MDD5740436.1 carboxyl transferase domain-containing protein [Candidatus Nanoarchaeia archaeon]